MTWSRIRQVLPFLFCIMLLTADVSCCAEDMEEDELLIEEIVEYVDLDEAVDGNSEWHFEIPLADLEPELIRLASKHYLLDKSYVPEWLVTIKTRNSDGSNGGVLKASGGSMQLSRVCAEALHQMSEAALADGYKLYLKSAYRSWQTQNTMYYNRLKRNNGIDDGWVNKPGSSDHQTGLGCDVVPRSWRDKSMNEKMASAPECQWMAEHCQEFGFILRYPEDKEELTEINYEPWHMRYVGIAAATYIMEHNLCLEEFTEELQTAIQEYLEAGGSLSSVEAFIQLPQEE